MNLFKCALSGLLQRLLCSTLALGQSQKDTVDIPIKENSAAITSTKTYVGIIREYLKEKSPKIIDIEMKQP